MSHDLEESPVTVHYGGYPNSFYSHNVTDYRGVPNTGVSVIVTTFSLGTFGMLITYHISYRWLGYLRLSNAQYYKNGNGHSFFYKFLLHFLFMFKLFL